MLDFWLTAIRTTSLSTIKAQHQWGCRLPESYTVLPLKCCVCFELIDGPAGSQLNRPDLWHHLSKPQMKEGKKMWSLFTMSSFSHYYEISWSYETGPHTYLKIYYSYNIWMSLSWNTKKCYRFLFVDISSIIYYSEKEQKKIYIYIYIYSIWA